MKEAELVGWIAVAVVLTNTFLMSFNFLSPAKNIKLFMCVQLFGAGLLLATALLLNFLPLIVLEVVIIALNVFRLAQMVVK